MSNRMYKILIADDEYWTREKFRNMIPWEEYSLQFMEPAKDGEDVLEKMKEEIPDILITDINMPFLNGVELLTEVQRQYPDVITFVISGYDDFEYVKGTFMAGAINYLLKPVNKIDLVNAIAKALEIISERESEKQELLTAASVIQDREFSQLIESKELPFMPSISGSSKIDLTGMSLVLIKIHNLQELMRLNGRDMNLLSYNVKKEIRRLLGENEAIVFNYVYRSNEFIIVAELLELELVSLAEKIKDYFSEFTKSHVTICISGHSYSKESIHMAYVEAVGLLMSRSFCAKDEILCMSAESKEKDKVKVHFGNELEKQLRSFLKTGNREGAAQVIFGKTGLDSCVERGWTYLEVKQTLQQILNVLADDICREKQQMPIEHMESIKDYVDKVSEYLDIDMMKNMLQDILIYLIPEQKEKTNDSMKKIVRQAAAWIDEHYFEEITLSSLAEQYYVDSTYLSKVFRQEIGENLIIYLTSKRMEKAKEYIRNSDINLTEIAFMVGYDDYTYFSRVFRKNVGISPREYRNQHQGEKE